MSHLYQLYSINSQTHLSSTQTIGNQKFIASIMVIGWFSDGEAERKILDLSNISEFNKSLFAIFHKNKTFL